MKRLFLLILVCLGVVCIDLKINAHNANKKDADEKEFDVYLLIGQSNMAGRGTMVEGDDLPFHNNIYLLNADGKAELATNPLNRYSSIRKDISMQQIGPGFSFSKKVADATGRKILLVVNAKGGSKIEEWAKGGKFYNDAVSRTRQALEYGNLKAILWHQGESDSDTPDGYCEKLKVIMNGLRKDLHAPSVPVIAGEIAPWHENHVKFNAEIHRIGKYIRHSDYVTSESCNWLIGTADPHFSRDGQIILGERYADKVLKMCRIKQKSFNSRKKY